MEARNLEFRENVNINIKQNWRKEIINGKIYYMAGASAEHNYIVNNIMFIFKKFLKGRRCKVFGENMAVKFDEEMNEVLPDIKIVCDPNKITSKEIKGAPDLIVEVLSWSTRKKDLIDKKELYEKFGVREYWIVDAESKSVEVNILRNGKFYTDNVYVCISDEERKEAELDGKPEEKEVAKIKSFYTSIYGDELEILISDIFEDI